MHHSNTLFMITITTCLLFTPQILFSSSSLLAARFSDSRWMFKDCQQLWLVPLFHGQQRMLAHVGYHDQTLDWLMSTTAGPILEHYAAMSGVMKLQI